MYIHYKYEMLDSAPYTIHWFEINPNNSIDATFQDEKGNKWRFVFTAFIQQVWKVDIISAKISDDTQFSTSELHKIISTFWGIFREFSQIKNPQYLYGASQIPSLSSFLNISVKFNRIPNFIQVPESEWHELDPYTQNFLKDHIDNPVPYWFGKNLYYISR